MDSRHSTKLEEQTSSLLSTVRTTMDSLLSCNNFITNLLIVDQTDLKESSTKRQRTDSIQEDASDATFSHSDTVVSPTTSQASSLFSSPQFETMINPEAILHLQ